MTLLLGQEDGYIEVRRLGEKVQFYEQYLIDTVNMALYGVIT